VQVQLQAVGEGEAVGEAVEGAVGADHCMSFNITMPIGL